MSDNTYTLVNEVPFGSRLVNTKETYKREGYVTAWSGASCSYGTRTVVKFFITPDNRRVKVESVETITPADAWAELKSSGH